MNYCTFVGKVYKKPELKQTNNGTNYCKFYLMVERSYKDMKDFVPIQAWKDVAKKCLVLEPDHMVLVTGSYQTNSFEKEGHKEYVHNIVAKDIQIIGTAVIVADKEEVEYPF